MLKYLATSFILLISVSLFAQDNNWKLEREKNGIRIFTRKGSSMKDSKAELFVKSSPQEIVAEFKKIDGHNNWMHRIVSCELIKKMSENEFVVYYVAHAPWPVSNRDIVAHYTIKKFPNGNYTIYAQGKSDLIPEKNGLIRIKRLSATWDLEKQADGTTKITYITSSEPGGSVPEWLTNSSALEAPYQTVLSLKLIVEK